MMAPAEVAVGSSRAVGAAPRVGLLYDDRMCAHAMPDGKYHEENPERLRAIWRKLTAEGVASRCVAMKAKEASEDCIASVHTENHVKLIKNISSKKYDSHRNRTSRRFNSIYFNEGSSESAFLAAGSVIKVSEKVATGELNSAIALVRPPGHHAEHDKPMGFCLFNNVAVGANHLLNERPDLGIKKLAILDWDAHHGNGTQKMFYEDPRVLFFSVHRFDGGNFYPFQKDASHRFVGKGAGKGYNINIPWEHAGCGDADYIAVWDHVLLPVAKAFDADIILLSAGFDAALGDPLGGCCITPNGYALLLTKLLGFAKGRIVMALEGGYNLESIANSVCACTKVLLGDKFTFDAPEMQPFESTWKIIQMVRDELKRYWPVLSSKLPENIPLRSTPSDIQVNFLSQFLYRLGARRPQPTTKNPNPKRKGKKIVPTSGTLQNLEENELSEEQVVAPSAEIVPTVATVQNMTENEISQEQAADAEQRLNENDRTERQETEPPAGDVQNADEIGLSRDASRTAENSQPTPDTSDGAIQCKLIVPSTYQGFSVLQDSEIHGFATADELRGAINANDGCLTEGQVLGLLHNLSVFQLQINDFPENEVIRKGVVMTVSGDARVLFPITTVYSTVGKILKEHGPQKLKISGIHIEKFEVKGNLWTRNRYTIDNTSHVYEWSTILNKEQVVLRRPRVSFADVVASNNRVVESNADVVASNNRVVESNAGVVAAGNRVVDACADVVAASTTLANSINGLATVIQAGRVH